MQNLKPLRREKGIRKPYIVADVEAAGWIHHLVTGIYDGKEANYFHEGKAFDNFSKKGDRLPEFLRYCLDHYSGYDCYAHFGGGYDFLFFLSGKLECKDIKIKSMIPRGSSLLSLEMRRGKKSITFRDSSALLPFRLADLTKNFGVEHTKLSIDYEKIKTVTPELLTYLSFDLKGLYESIQKFQENELIQKSGTAYTIASQSLRVFRTYLKEPISGLTDSQDYFSRQSYMGGRTEIFRPLARNCKLFEYDVNSLYPFVMRENEFPIKFYARTFEYHPQALAIYKTRVSMPDMYLPPLGVLRDGKFIFPTGNFVGTFTSAEIAYAKTLGAKFEIIEGMLFSSGGKIFREFIDDLYAIRQKSAKNSVDNIIAKLMMNSLYGRFGLDLDKEVFEFDEGQPGVFEGPEIKSSTGDLYRLMKRPVKLRTFNNVAIASFVTSYARIHMHRLMSLAPKEIYYTDTDSLFTTHKYATSDRLGDLKLEREHSNACFLLPKTYRTDSKIAMKGFDKKKIQHLEFEDFVNALEGSIRLKDKPLKRDKDGDVDEVRDWMLKVDHDPKFAKIKSAIRQGKFLTMLPAHTRRIMSQYDKRIIFKSGDSYDSKPIQLREE